MTNDGEFLEHVRRIGKLVEEFDLLPDSPAKAAGRELIQLFMELHGAGLERAMEIISGSGNQGSEIVAQLGQDSIAGSLLLLYTLHPDPLETRVQKAVERLRPRLRKLACAIEFLGIQENAVRVRIAVSGHSCGSSTKDLRTIVEDGIYELAPDVALVEILGLEEPVAAGFVPLEKLSSRLFADISAIPAREGAD